MFGAEYYEILRFYIHQLFEVGFSKAVRMCAALPFVVLYDTEFILDTNAIDCYHKFDHQPLLGEATEGISRGQGRTFGLRA